MYQMLYEKYKNLQSEYCDAEQNNLVLNSELSSRQEQIEYLTKEKEKNTEIVEEKEEFQEEINSFKQECENYRESIGKFSS